MFHVILLYVWLTFIILFHVHGYLEQALLKNIRMLEEKQIYESKVVHGNDAS